MSQAKAYSYVEPASVDLMQGVTPATNADNLAAAGKQPASATEELTAFMTRYEVKPMLKEEKENVSAYIISLLNPSYPAEITMKPYPIGYVAPQFQKFNGRRGKTHEHVVCFHVPIRAHCYDQTLCSGVFSKSNYSCIHVVCES